MMKKLNEKVKGFFLRLKGFQWVQLISISGFFILFFLMSTHAVNTFDLKITHTIQSLQNPLFAAFMTSVSWVGFAPQSFILVALIVMLIYGFGLKWEASVLLLNTVVVQALNMLVKIIIQRPRPAADLVQVVAALQNYSFPSGHVMFYTGFFGFLWFLTYLLLKSSWKRNFLLVILSSVILMIGVSRIYLGAHWASDVIGAYLLAVLVLMGAIQYYHWGKSRRFLFCPAHDKNGNNDDNPSNDLYR